VPKAIGFKLQAGRTATHMLCIGSRCLSCNMSNTVLRHQRQPCRNSCCAHDRPCSCEVLATWGRASVLRGGQQVGVGVASRLQQRRRGAAAR
jgi:hypothetical protein